MKEKKLFKSSTDKKICGVCGGLAQYLGIESTIVRLVAALLFLCCGVGVGIYIVCALVLPKEEDVVSKVQDVEYTNVETEEKVKEEKAEN